MTHVTYFNRHENMSANTLRKIRELIQKSVRTTESLMGVTNMLYGLYDGYLYTALLPDAKKALSTDDYNELKVVVAEIEKYPKTETDTTEH